MKPSRGSRDIHRHPLVVLGLVVLAVTPVVALLADGTAVAVAVQAALPLAIGVAMVGYGWYDTRRTGTFPRTLVFKWAGVGLGAFFLVGFWFGQVSRLFDTSFIFAVYSSLATGALLGCVIGVYAARLHRTNEELREQNERMAEVASIVSHDLRNPLTVAQGRVELARETEDDADAGDRREEHLSTVVTSLDRMEVLVDDLLTLTRRSRVSDPREVPLSVVAERSWEVVETGGVALDATDDVVEADPDQLRHLFENCFRNAVEHGEADAVRVGTLADGGGFFVEDDGVGIPVDERDAVLDSGYSTAGEGTGLGLAIVAEVATAHGWEVRVTESETGGARFEFVGAAVTPAPDHDAGDGSSPTSAMA